MTNLAAQLAVALCQNPANPVRNEDDAYNIAHYANLIATRLEDLFTEGEFSEINTEKAIILQPQNNTLLSINQLAEQLNASPSSVKRLTAAFEEVAKYQATRNSNNSRCFHSEFIPVFRAALNYTRKGISRKEAILSALSEAKA